MMMPSLQTGVVALLVVGSTAYAAWALMPSGWRRSLAGRLLTLPWLPPALARRLRSASLATSGCGCDGCDHAPAKASPAHRPAGASNRLSATAQPITFHPRVRH